MKATKLIFSLSFLVNIITINCEIFTSTHAVEELITSEYALFEELKDFIQIQQRRLNSIGNILQQIEIGLNQSKLTGFEQSKHPLAILLLVRRFLTYWQRTENILKEANRSKEELLDSFANHKHDFPSFDDLVGSADAILRLQDVYNLQEIDLANGKIHGSKDLGVELNWFDCFAIGRRAYETEDYRRSYKWMKQALARYDNEMLSIHRLTLLDYLAFSAYKIGYLREALSLTLEMAKLDPKHERAARNIYHYQKLLDEHDATKETLASEDNIQEKPDQKGTWEQEFFNYKLLCRGSKTSQDQFVDRKLGCYNKWSPRLLFRSVRVEELSKEPYIVVYHNILREFEIETLKNLAVPMLQRATVYNAYGTLEPATYRISESAWLQNSHHFVVRRISELLEDLTGLNMDTAEDLQIANYGIGGHYEPHYDHATSSTEAFSKWNNGNRIATALFYLSDVEAGGATVFSSIGVRIAPSKGSMAFWYNLHRNGDGNKLTRHAGCPVLVGSKWIANKWIHQVGQELRHLCSVDHAE